MVHMKFYRVPRGLAREVLLGRLYRNIDPRRQNHMKNKMVN